MQARVWTCAIVALVGAVGVVTLSPCAPAGAHPSPLDSLTLDLLVDQSGLVVIDGAANRATYDDAPSPAERALIAGQVVDGLGIPHDTVQVDDEASDLYHEVGFRISLHRPFANTGDDGTVRVDTSRLQVIAASLGTLTLDVCRIEGTGLALTVDASAPSTPPDPAGAGAPQTDRADCRAWVLHADDPPVTVSARVTSAGASTPAAEARVELPCGAPSTGDPTFVVEGPISRQSGTLQAHASGASSSHLLQADAVLGFSTRTRVDLLVPKSAIGHLSFGPRSGPRATRRLRTPECPYDQASPWTVSVIRIWVDRAACVPVIVETPRSRRTVRLPVGAPCEKGAP